MIKHGMRRTAEYRAWSHMKDRCFNPKDRGYKNWGGRGITICQRWHKFENFFEDMGFRPSPKHSLDRINNNGNYEPGNCRWALKKVQLQNTRKNIYYDLPEGRLCQSEAARIRGISIGLVRLRLRQGFPLEQVFAPVWRYKNGRYAKPISE